MTAGNADTAHPLLIVVPTLDEAEHVEEVATALLTGLRRPVVLAVADGGSTDGTREIVARLAAADPRIRLVDNPDRIQSAGVNRAVREAAGTARWLLRADAHASYPAGYAERLVAEIEETGAQSVCVTMTTEAEGSFQAGAAAAQNSVIGTGGSAHRAGRGGRWVDHGHHALFELDAFRALGGYDESFTHNEDAEFDRRLVREGGGRIWLSGTVSIGYRPRRTPGALLRQYYRYGRGRAAMLLKHRLVPKLRQMLPLAVPAAIALACIGAVASLVGGTAWLVLAVPLLAWVALCCGWGAVLALRARRAAVLWSGPAAMLMHLGWASGFLSRIAAACRPTVPPMPRRSEP